MPGIEIFRMSFHATLPLGLCVRVALCHGGFDVKAVLSGRVEFENEASEKHLEGLSTGPPLSANANSSTMLLKGQFPPSYFGFTGDARQTGRLGECVTWCAVLATCNAQLCSGKISPVRRPPKLPRPAGTSGGQIFMHRSGKPEGTSG